MLRRSTFGKATAVDREASSHGVAADARHRWADGDRIVFPWKREGRVHLYSVPGGPSADFFDRHLKARRTGTS